MGDERLNDSIYLICRRILSWKLFVETCRIYDSTGRLCFVADQKGFKLSDDIRLYTDESKKEDALLIQARQIIRFSAAYDVIDAVTAEKIGAFKRKGWKSLAIDEWILMDAHDTEIGKIGENSPVLALLRRYVAALIPQTYHLELENSPVCTFKQIFSPFALKLSVDFSPDFRQQLDRRLGIAAGVLLCAVCMR
jgi:hypothetical protein